MTTASTTASPLVHPGATSSSRWAWLFDPVPIDSLVAFRVFFGLMAGLDCFWFLQQGWIATTFLDPPLLFKYYGFGWVHPWPGIGLYLHFTVLVCLAAAICCGFLYRIATILFALGFTYVFLLEKAIYLNHMYLICLLSGILATIPAHRAWSVDVWCNPRLRSETAPRWCLWLLRFQIAVPYVYGGLAKLNRDWLSGDTMFMFFVDQGDYPVFGSVMSSNVMVLLFTYGGLLFDLSIVPLLLWRRTRFVAFVATVAFHLVNSQLFQIGIFPWLMIGATTIFFPPDWPRRFLQVPVSAFPALGCTPLSRRQAGVLVVLSAYAAFQLVFPLRHLVTAGDPSWTDEGHTFSWRMMLRAKLARVEFTAVDTRTGRRGPMPPERFLNPRQVRNLTRSPDLMLQYSHFLADKHRRLGGGPLQVFCRAECSLNGRRPQLLIDPAVDLAAQPRSMWPAKWIMPLTQPAMTEAVRRDWAQRAAQLARENRAKTADRARVGS